MADGLIKMKRFGDRFYFGFSSVVNRRSYKTPQVLLRTRAEDERRQFHLPPPTR
jgi:hypothetical protein